MKWEDHITIDPGILVGKPVIKGTRLAVEFIIGLLAQGWTEENIIRNYPGITREDILACLSYASDILKSRKYTHFHQVEHRPSGFWQTKIFQGMRLHHYGELALMSLGQARILLEVPTSRFLYMPKMRRGSF